MHEPTERSIDEILDELQRINREFREKIRSGFQDPNCFMKLSEIEQMGRELSAYTQKLYIEETETLLNEIDESMLLCKKNRIPGKRNNPYPVLA